MRRVLKWIGIGVGGLVVLALLAALGLVTRGYARFHHSYQASDLLPAVVSDPLTVANGEHVVQLHGCRGCHGPDLGGRLFLDITPVQLIAPNLTRGRGGIGGTYTDQDWDRAIRQGLRPSGKPLIPIMPYALFNRLSDPDAAALIAYLKTVPPVDNDLPPTRVRLPGYFMVGLAGAELLHPHLPGPPRPAPEAAPTAAYGQYLTSHMCVECHGEDLRGGRHPSGEGPPAPGLAAAGVWPWADFARAVRTGIAPGGRTLSPLMPSKDALEHLSDVEVQALHEYLKTLQTSANGHTP